MAEDETHIETEDEQKPDKTSIVDAVKEVLADLGIIGSGETNTEETATDDDPDDEIESSRQQESRMRKAVEKEVGGLHIHIDSKGEQNAETKKPKPESTPGKRPFLERFVGLGS